MRRLREQLESLANSRSLPAGLVRRAKIIFAERFWEDERGNWAATGDQQGHGKSVAVPISPTGVSGLYDELRRAAHARLATSECPISSQDAEDETQSRNALEYPANCRRDRSIEIDGAPHLASVWLAAASAKTVQAFERSIFCRKGTGYCRAVLEIHRKMQWFWCVDEKSGIQALERTQPMLPLGLGYVEGVTHDYRRHGTTTLFAALDTANGKVLTKCRPRHRHQEYLSFSREIEKNVPKNLEGAHQSWIITPRTSICE